MNKRNKAFMSHIKEMAAARKSQPPRVKKSNLGKNPTNVIYVDFVNKKVGNIWLKYKY